MSTERTIKHIFHPTDLSGASEVAFFHALRIAVETHASLTIMHVDADEGEDLAEGLPQVRRTLKKWGMLKDENDMEEFLAMRMRVRKLVVTEDDPLGACQNYLKDHPTDLVVLSTHQHPGGWFSLQGRVAEPLMRSVGARTLLLPHKSHGFIGSATGEVSLRRVLIPIATDPDPAQALRAAVSMAQVLAAPHVEFTLLHVGTGVDAPKLELPSRAGWTWTSVVRDGDVVDAILDLAKEMNTDLIVMATRGHDGFLDVLRGSTTERVLRGAACPLLTDIA